MACQGCREGGDFPIAITTAFHPIVDVTTGEPFAYEALVRGVNGESAGEVLAHVTDENRYTFDQLCRVTAIREAVAAGLLEGQAKLSINFLPNAVYSPLACIQLTLKTAGECGMPADRLIFEFTENERLEPAHMRSIIDAYRKLGFATALDDFGAGHAGLGLLANLQTDMIKLDMELIRGIDQSVPRRQIVSCMVRLCEEMGMTVIAEGVETPAELRVIKEIGVRPVQGYVFGRPTVGQLIRPGLAEGLRTAA